MNNPARKTPWAWTIATFAGTGLLKPGPGTWASTAAALLWLAAGSWLGLSPGHLAVLTGLAALATFAIGVPASTVVARESGRKDPGFVVIDEAAGQWLALTFCSLRLGDILAAFVLFRLFDIVKPWPARQLEKLPAGWGIMCDDLAAGVYALLVVQLLLHWFR